MKPHEARVRQTPEAKRISRGHFVTLAGMSMSAVAIGGLLPLDTGLVLADAAPSAATHQGLNLHGFQACLGDTFVIRGGRVVTRASLAKVTDLNAGGSIPRLAGECFVLQFRGNHASSLTQNTYRFEHPRLGTFPLFIVPSGAHEYDAVINRIDG